MTQEELNAKMLAAALDGNLHEMERLLGQGASIEARDEHGRSLLNRVAYRENVPAVEWLISRHAEVNSIEPHSGLTPLMQAARDPNSREKCIQIIRLLLDAGADPECLNAGGKTAASLAAGKSFTEAVTLLNSHVCSSKQVGWDERMGDRILQNIFNFEIRKKVVYVRKSPADPVEAFTRQDFSEVEYSDLRRAFDLYRKKGGKMTEEEVFTGGGFGKLRLESPL